MCLFFRCWVADFLFYIILALLLPRFLCFFSVCVLVCQSCEAIAFEACCLIFILDIGKIPWNSQNPAKEQWSSSRILSIWLPRSDHVFRWVIWLPSPSMLTCRLPRKDPGRRTASNCRFLSPIIMVNWKNNWKLSGLWFVGKKAIHGYVSHDSEKCWGVEMSHRVFVSTRLVKLKRQNTSQFLRYYESWCNTIFHARLFFHVKSNPQNIFLIFCCSPFSWLIWGWRLEF